MQRIVTEMVNMSKNDERTDYDYCVVGILYVVDHSQCLKMKPSKRIRDK